MSFEDVYKVISKSSAIDSRRTRYTLYVSWVVLPVVLLFPLVNAGLLAQVLRVLLAIVIAANLIVFSTNWLWGKERIPFVAVSATLVTLLYFAYLGIGEGGSVLWMFVFPLLAMFMLGAFWGLAGSIFSLTVSIWIMSSGSEIDAYPYSYEFTLRFIISYSLVMALTFGFEYWRVSLELQKEVVDNELLKTKDILAGLTNVCSWCSSIRTADETWVSLEDYVSRKEDTGISHAICPECAKKEQEQLPS